MNSARKEFEEWFFDRINGGAILETLCWQTWQAAESKQCQRIEELEQWIAAIADNHPQIPDWIQQSARSLLAKGGE